MNNPVLNTKSTDLSRAPWGKRTQNFALSVLSLLLGYAVIRVFHLETELGLPKLFLIVSLGFVAYYWLAERYRPIFLPLLNALALFSLFGGLAGGLALAFGGLLFTVVNLPLSTYARAGLALVAGAGLALLKLGFLPGPALGVAATVVGGLFMFRTLVFLYETHHTPALGSFWERVNYFFLLPNLIFVIFPVVDFKTFLRVRQTDIDRALLTKALHWIFRGLFHLVLYRLIYYYLVPAPSETFGVFGVLRFMVTSYLLIVRLSGVFHLSAGIVCLFGYNLPPTFDNYFLATGFSDLWRRINVYWRDFMMKVFYFPLYFRFKNRTALVVVFCVMVVFLVNWFLHQYQYFWITGTFPVTAVDAIFWLGFGILVAANSVLQMNRPRSKRSAKSFSWRNAALTTLQVMGMFLFMSALWSFWTSPTIGYWVDFVGGAFPLTTGQLAGLAGLVIVVFCGGLLAARAAAYLEDQQLFPSRETKLAGYFAGWLLATALVLPPSAAWLEDRFAVNLDPVREARLNAADAERRFEGYYETLLEGKDVSTFGLEGNVQPQDESGKRLRDYGIINQDRQKLVRRLYPDTSIVFKGARLTTNEHGLRDRPYTKARPTGTLRVALLGGSIEMGTGVADRETFENLVEDSLAVAPLGPACSRVEIINFGISGMRMVNQVAKVEEALSFGPQILLYAVHPAEFARGLSSWRWMYDRGDELNFVPPNEIFTKAGLSADQSPAEMENRLRPFAEDLIGWMAAHISNSARERGATPVLLFVPVLGQDRHQRLVSKERTINLFREAGFLVLDIEEAYSGSDDLSLQIAPKDTHPNARGHQLLAAELYGQLIRYPELRDLFCFAANAPAGQ